MTRMIFGGEKPKSKKFGLRFGRTNSGRGSRPYSGSKPHFADDDLLISGMVASIWYAIKSSLLIREKIGVGDCINNGSAGQEKMRYMY